MEEWVSITLSDIASCGAFARGEKILKIESEGGYDNHDALSSIVFFLTVTTDKQRHRVVLKTPSTRKEIRDDLASCLLMANEVHFYSEILPFLTRGSRLDIFPHFFYGHCTLGEAIFKEALLIEDLRGRGLKAAPFKRIYDSGHLEAGLRALAQFHALSYKAKERDGEGFEALTSRLYRPRWLDGTSFGEMQRYASLRGIDQVLKKGKHKEVLSELRARVEASPCKAVRDTWKRSKMDVLCHADFVGPNLLFKYDGGVPVSATLIDFQCVAMDSPLTDVLFYLAAHTGSESRERDWDRLVDFYYKELESACGGCWLPSLENLQASMRDKWYGAYAPCCFFIPYIERAEIPPVEFISMGATERKDFVKGLCQGDTEVARLLDFLVSKYAA